MDRGTPHLVLENVVAGYGKAFGMDVSVWARSESRERARGDGHAVAASKAALIGFTKSVAREFGSRGTTVNGLAPGFIETDMTAVLSEA